MRLTHRLAALALLLSLAGLAAAQEPPALATAQGVVEKVGRDSVTVRPRGADGRFEKSLVLKVTGTTRVSRLAPQTRGGKTVLTQTDTEVKDLHPRQAIAFIYTGGKDEGVLLHAVVEPASEK
jgi:hypothetical protein